MSEYQVRGVRQKERADALGNAALRSATLARSRSAFGARVAPLAAATRRCGSCRRLAAAKRQGPGPRPPLMRGPPGPLSGVPFGAALPRGMWAPKRRSLRPSAFPALFLPTSRPALAPCAALGCCVRSGAAPPPLAPVRRFRPRLRLAGAGPPGSPPPSKLPPLCGLAPSAVGSAPPVPWPALRCLWPSFGRPWLSPCGPSVPCRGRRVPSAGPPSGLWARSGSGRGGAGGRVAAFFPLAPPGLLSSRLAPLRWRLAPVRCLAVGFSPAAPRPAAPAGGSREHRAQLRGLRAPAFGGPPPGSGSVLRAAAFCLRLPIVPGGQGSSRAAAPPLACRVYGRRRKAERRQRNESCRL